MTNTFGVRPLYDDSCDQARTFGVSHRAFSYEHQIPGEPRQSLPMNYAADRIVLDPPGLVIEPSAGRPLPMNDGRVAGTFSTLRSRSGLTTYSSLIVERLGRYQKKLLGREV